MRSNSFFLIAILFTSILHQTPIVNGIPDAYEPNNSLSTATTLLNNTMQTHTIDPIGDIDFFNFTVLSNTVVTIWTDGINGDNEMWLYNSFGTELAYNDDYDGLWAGIYTNLDSGKYSIKITQYNSSEIISSYDIYLLIGVINKDIYEPDDSFSTATTLLNNTMQSHSINPVGDVDYFNFTVTDIASVVISTDGIRGDNEMWLYNSFGTELAYNDDYVSLWAGIQIELDSGNYSIKIAQLDSFGVISNYDIYLLISTITEDIYEPDDSYGTAKNLIVGTPQDHSIFPVGDIDYFNITLTQSIIISVWTSGSFILDTQMWLYDSSGTQLAYNDDFDGEFSKIIISLSPGVYTVKVAVISPTAIGNYIIQYVISPSTDAYEPDDSFATATILLNNTIQTHNINPIGDFDYFNFSVTDTASITIWTEALNGNIEMWLHSSFGTVLANSINYGSLWGGMEIDLDSGDYSIKVAQLDSNEIISSYDIYLLIFIIGLPDINSTQTVNTENSDTAKVSSTSSTPSSNTTPEVLDLTGSATWFTLMLFGLAIYVFKRKKRYQN